MNLGLGPLAVWCHRCVMRSACRAGRTLTSMNADALILAADSALRTLLA